jgi:hypothetical protein
LLLLLLLKLDEGKLAHDCVLIVRKHAGVASSGRRGDSSGGSSASTPALTAAHRQCSRSAHRSVCRRRRGSERLGDQPCHRGGLLVSPCGRGAGGRGLGGAWRAR